MAQLDEIEAVSVFTLADGQYAGTLAGSSPNCHHGTAPSSVGRTAVLISTERLAM
jgi:hypothetical protein